MKSKKFRRPWWPDLNITEPLVRVYFHLHISLAYCSLWWETLLPIFISLHTGCSSRRPQDWSKVEDKPCLWCHLLLYRCQPISMLCGKPASMPCSVVEEDERNRGRITYPPFLQVAMFLSVLKIVKIYKYVILYIHSKAIAFPLNICDCRDLLSEFHSSLSDIKKKKPLVMLVDGVDLVRDGRGQLNSDWIPQQLPQVSYRHEKLRENTHTHTPFLMRA